MSKKTMSALLTGLFIVLFFGGVAYIKLKKGVDFVAQPGSVRERMLRHPGRKQFDVGAYNKIVNRTLEESCNFKKLSRRMGCEEGYGYVHFSKEMNSFFKLPENSQNVLGVEIGSVSMALGAGVALSRLGKTPLDIQIKGNPNLIKYVYDGWGLSETILGVFYKQESHCIFESEYQKYCLFGVGRALFFLDTSLDVINQTDPSTQKGYLFARIFGGELPAIGADQQIEKLAVLVQEGPLLELNTKISCDGILPDHIMDCKVLSLPIR